MGETVQLLSSCGALYWIKAFRKLGKTDELNDFLNDYCRDCEVNENGICTERENVQETESGDE